MIGFEKWLRRAHPTDVLMPCPKGTKRPMFGHKCGTWTWDRLAAYRTPSAPSKGKRPVQEADDYCVVLRELCVLDIDDPQLVRLYEARFPVLLDKDVPCVQTAKGRHYWFRRPVIADTHGYYDGRAQREKGVDFKSVCRTGTGGIIMVPPSTGKSWIRHPSSLDPKVPEMPADLLDAVAVATHAIVDATLSFCPPGSPLIAVTLTLAKGDGDRVTLALEPMEREVVEYRGLRWFAAMDYFEPFLSGEIIEGTDVWNVPTGRAAFDDLVRVLDFLPLGGPPTRARVGALLGAADILGLSPHLVRAIVGGALREAADLYDLDPDWWAADAADTSTQLVPVSDPLELKKKVKDARWLFQNQKDANCRGLVLDPAASLTESLPAEVLWALRKHPKLCLAGGAVTGAVVRGCAKGADFDLFLHSATEEEADAIVDDVGRAMPKGTSFSESGNAITMCLPGGDVVQIVKRLHETMADVVRSFDIPPCKALAYFPPEGEGRIMALPSWVEAARSGAFWVNPRAGWSVGSVARVIKYVAKGFEAVVPGTQRGAFRTPLLSAGEMMPAGDTSVRGLFEAERYLIGRNGSRRVSADDAVLVAKKVGAWSDYSAMTKALGRIWHAVTAVFSRAMGAVGEFVRLVPRGGRRGPPAPAPASAPGKRGWHTAPLMNPRDHGLRSLYDPALLRPRN